MLLRGIEPRMKCPSALRMVHLVITPDADILLAAKRNRYSLTACVYRRGQPGSKATGYEQGSRRRATPIGFAAARAELPAPIGAYR